MFFIKVKDYTLLFLIAISLFLTGCSKFNYEKNGNETIENFQGWSFKFDESGKRTDVELTRKASYSFRISIDDYIKYIEKLQETYDSNMLKCVDNLDYKFNPVDDVTYLYIKELKNSNSNINCVNEYLLLSDLIERPYYYNRGQAYGGEIKTDVYLEDFEGNLFFIEGSNLNYPISDVLFENLKNPVEKESFINLEKYSISLLEYLKYQNEKYNKK